LPGHAQEPIDDAQFGQQAAASRAALDVGDEAAALRGRDIAIEDLFEKSLS
jgi:hypothetical protein